MKKNNEIHMAEKPKKNIRVQQGIETKQKLYESAARLFMQHSFDQVSVEDITRSVGVTKGTFYVHFASKDALIASLIRDYTSKTDLHYRAFLQSLPADLSTRGKLMGVTESIVNEVVDEIGYPQIKKVYELMLTNGSNTHSVFGYQRDIYQILHEIIETGIKQKEVDVEIPLDDFVKHLVIGLRGCIFEWCVQYPILDLKELCVTQINLMTTGSIK